jgi:hypothetical protein
MDYNNVAKVAKSSQCVCCDYTTSKLANYNKHILTTKHKRNVAGLHKVAKVAKIIKDDKQYICDCGMVYKYRQGLYKHHKTCFKPDNNINNIDSLTDKQLIINLLQQNGELQKSLIELSKEKTITNSNNTNSHNKTFNLQFFLNETFFLKRSFFCIFFTIHNKHYKVLFNHIYNIKIIFNIIIKQINIIFSKTIHK